MGNLIDSRPVYSSRSVKWLKRQYRILTDREFLTGWESTEFRSSTWVCNMNCYCFQRFEFVHDILGVKENSRILIVECTLHRPKLVFYLLEIRFYFETWTIYWFPFNWRSGTILCADKRLSMQKATAHNCFVHTLALAKRARVPLHSRLALDSLETIESIRIFEWMHEYEWGGANVLHAACTTICK